MASNSDIIKIGFDYKDNLEKFLKDYDGTMDQVQKSADGKRIEIQFDVTDKNVMKKISSLQGEFKNVKIELDGKPLERQLDSIEDIKKVLTNVVDMVNKRMSFDSLFDTKSLTKELEIFSKIEDHLSSLRSVISDVGDGEELSPLLKTIEKVSEAVSNLNMKFNMNIDVGSDNEMERELQKKASNALLAYENLREHLFSTYRGDNYTSELLYKFDPSQFDTTIGKIEGYKKFIENLRASIKENYGHDKLYEDSDKSYWNKASAAYGQITKVRNAMKADSEGSPLDNLFGSKTDLTEVIEQLKLIVTELGNVSAAAAEIKTVLGNGIQINDSLQQIEALTQKVKELETELTSLKSGTSLPSTETNISFESSSMEQVQKSTDQAVQAKEDFAKANASVQASVDESKSPLQLEAELMEKIAESARKAADAKKEFVEANGKVAASAKESNVSLNSDLTSGHSEISEPTGIKKYQKKGYKAHDTGNHDNEKKVVNKKELGNALKELQSEIIANIDSANSFIKDVTDFYDSNDNLVKTQMKVLDKNGNMSTYTTSYSMDKDGNATAWTSHIDSQKFEDKNQEYQNQLKTIRELSAEKQKLQEQDRKSEVNQALKDQLYAYKQIQSIREKIASTDDENLIAELEKQKQTYQEQYLTATKILKNNSDLYNSESRLNELLQIGLKTTQKISEAEIKRNSAADNKKVKEWDDINAKNQADIWKKNQKAIQNYVNAVKKLQDLLAEDKGTGSKAAAIEKQQGKIKQLEEEALNARAILSSMVNPHTSDASTWDAWVKTMDKLSDASHDAKAAVDDVKKSIQAAQASEIKSMNDGLADYEAKMRSFNNRKPEDRRSDYSTALKNYTDALERYRNELQKIQNHPELINETEINSLKNMRNELDKAATSLKGIEKGSTAISRDKMISKISDYMKKNSAMSKEFKSELEGLIQKLKTLGAEADTTRIADEFFKITQRIREAGQEGKKFWDVVKEKAWYGLAGTIGTYFGFNDLIQYGRQGVQIVRELDTQLTEMMKVSNESAQSLKNYQNTTFDVADTVGTTAKQIQASTADYMRLGESLDEAAESAKTANILLNVSEFSNIEDATKSLVAMGQAYKNLDKLTIVDKLNEVGKLIAQTYSNV
nr:MAG TPA: minor tail protein [Caudoviricetes sp.]